MITGHGATISKYRLSGHLAVLRESRAMTQVSAATAAGWEQHKLRSIESNSWTSVPMDDVLTLVRLYEAGNAERSVIEDLAARCQAQSWWQDYPGIFDTEYVGFENDADMIRGFSPLLLPAQLQTRAYAEALVAAEPRSPAWRRRAAEAVLRRQQILDRPEPPVFKAVFTQAALKSRWGSRADRHAQILHLLDMSKRDNIELRICTFDDGLTPSLCSTVSILDFPGDGPPLVWTDTGLSVELVTAAAAVRSHIESFERISEAAPGPQATTDFLERLASEAE